MPAALTRPLASTSALPAPSEPPLPRPQAELCDHIHLLLEKLLEVGICTTDVQPEAVEGNGRTAFSDLPGGLLGSKITETVDHLIQLEALVPSLMNVPIPKSVLEHVDKGKNPHAITRRFLERVSAENQYTNGVIHSIQGFRNDLAAGLNEHFPQASVSPTTVSLPNMRSLAADAPAPAGGPPAQNGVIIID